MRRGSQDSSFFFYPIHLSSGVFRFFHLSPIYSRTFTVSTLEQKHVLSKLKTDRKAAYSDFLYKMFIESIKL